MKMSVLNQKRFVLILVTVLLTCGAHGISYGQAAPTVSPGDDDTSLVVEFRHSWEFGDFREVFYLQSRKKTPQGPWKSACVEVNLRDLARLRPGESVTATLIFELTRLEPGTTYQVRYNNDTGEFLCSFADAHGPWSDIGEGTTTGTAAPPPPPPPDNGQSDDEPSDGNTYSSGEVIPTWPTGSRFPNRLSGASYQSSGGTITASFNNGGLIVFNGITYTCVAAGGCRIEGRRVTQGTIQVGGTDPPPPENPSDLVVEQPSVSKSTLASGEDFTLSATVRNQGEARADGTTLRYYRSTDATISSSDTEIGTDSVSSLSANRTGAESIRLTAPTSSGTYYYGACVDSVDNEDNTANNCSDAVQITVEPPPESDLVVEQPSVSKSTLAPGEDFTLSTTVRNQGEARADGTTLRYYRSTDATISSSDTEIGTDSLSTLDVNQTGDESIRLTAPTSAGVYYYGACVDNVANETTTANNCSDAVQITVERSPTELVKLSGDNQSGVIGEVLSSSFVVEVRDQDGTPFEGVTVMFAVTAGDGMLSVTTATTDANGLAETTLILGSTPGANTVSATVDGITQGVTFNAMGEGIEFDLSVPSGTNLIHVPLKVTEVNGAAQTIESVSDLYDALGGASKVIFLATYDPQTQQWAGYFGPADKGTSVDKGLTDDIGILANMVAPTSVDLTGTPLGTNGTSTITLTPGFNVVGLPLRNSGIKHVSDLLTLDGISGNVQGIILTDGGEFKFVTQMGDPSDIPIVGGQAFMLYAQQEAMVEISGEGWDNPPVMAAAPLVGQVNLHSPLTGLQVTDTTSVLGLKGSIVDEAMGLNQGGFRVTVKNLSTGKAVTPVTGYDETGYRHIIVDIETGRAAMIGDILEISAQSPHPFIGVQPLRYTVTAEDVKQNLIQLPELLAYEIPAETQLLANYPNPFNPETWIPYRLAEDGFVTLTIYDGKGQVVRTIDVGHRIAAAYESRSKAIYWDGRNEFGQTVASGIYFYHLSAVRSGLSVPHRSDYSATRKMLILK